jgi:hypothetical protein
MLTIYSIYDPQTSYCQGMNYIVGWLYTHTMDEELTFKFFV